MTSEVERPTELSEPAAVVRAFYKMLFVSRPSGELFDQVIHDDFVLEDHPVGVKVSGKEGFWPAVDVPDEAKQGPGTLSFGSEFIEYIGSGDIVSGEGNARWTFRPAAGYGALWGITDPQVFDGGDSVEIEVVARVSLRDGKVCRIREIWNPVPLLQKVGVDIPSPVQAS